MKLLGFKASYVFCRHWGTSRLTSAQWTYPLAAPAFTEDHRQQLVGCRPFQGLYLHVLLCSALGPWPVSSYDARCY